MSDSNPTTNNEPSESQAEESHLEAARAFFKESGGVIRPEDRTLSAPPAATSQTTPPANEKPAAKTEDKPATKPSLLSSVLKAEGTQETPPAAPAADQPPEDVFKGLNAPDEKSKFRPDWDKAKGVAETLRKTNAELQAKLAAAEAQAKASTPPAADEATKARLAQLENENKSMSERLKVFDLRNHPEFQKEFEAPKLKSISTIERLLKEEGVQGVDLKALLSLKGKPLYEQAGKIAEQLSTFNQPVFAGELRRILEIDEGAAAALANVDQFRDSKSKEFAARSRQAFDQVAAQFSGAFLPQSVDEKASPEEKASATAYNAALQERAKLAERYAFTAGNETDASTIAQKAASYDFLMVHALPRIDRIAQGQVADLSAKLAAAQAELAGLKVAQPKTGATTSGDAAGAGGGTEPSLENLSHREAARRFSWHAQSAQRGA